jgi:hypothetical protein
MQVQEELIRRGNLRNGKDGSKRLYSAKYALSNIVFCGECGEIYRRVHWNNRGKKSVVWRCVSRLEEKGSECTSATILEEDLQNAVLKAINSIVSDRDGFIRTLEQNILAVLGEEHDFNIDEIDAKLEELQNELLRLANSKSAYDGVAEDIHRLRQLREGTLIRNAERQNRRQRIAEMMEFLHEQSGVILEYDDRLVRRLVEKVTVNQDGIIVEFKSGVEVGV